MCDKTDMQCAMRLMANHIDASVQHLRHPAAIRLHCRSVSCAAQTIAQALAASGQTVNTNKAGLMGMIHDLGRSRAGDVRHGIEGYWLAREAGFPAEIAKVCITHMTMGRTLDEAVGEGLLTTDEANRLAGEVGALEDMGLEEQIVGVVDSRVLNGHFVALSERIMELEERKGPLTPGMWHNLNRIEELVASFAQVLGHSLALLFPGGNLGLGE